MKLDHDWLDLDIPENVVLGEQTYLYSAYAFLRYRSEAAVGLRVGRHTAVYDATMFDLGPRGHLELGDYCILNSPVIAVDSSVVIGSFAYISYEVYLADTADQLPPPCRPSSGREPQCDAEPSIVIGDDCWIGMRSVVLAGTRLGDGVIVGAGSVVDAEFPSYSIVAGNPAQVVGSVQPGEGSRAGSKPFRVWH